MAVYTILFPMPSYASNVCLRFSSQDSHRVKFAVEILCEDILLTSITRRIFVLSLIWAKMISSHRISAASVSL
jgi:hypothetical protein